MTALTAQGPLRQPDLASMGIVAAKFDEAMKSESLALVLWCFEKVSTLQSVELTVSVDHPKDRFGALSYSSRCSVTLSHTPSQLMLPQLDRNAKTVNVVELFTQRGGRTDEEFRVALGDYFNDVWPAFDDRSHLFGGVGTLRVTREDATDILNGSDPVEIYQRLRALVD